MNSFLGVTMLLPALGGALVDWINAPVVFALCATLSVFGYRAACRLPGRADIATRGLPAPALAEATAPRGGGAE
jgi:hypothetical protein